MRERVGLVTKRVGRKLVFLQQSKRTCELARIGQAAFEDVFRHATVHERIVGFAWRYFFA